jgi:hypothetical protein
MDGFQFIIESPHQSRHRKRPRLVTSCDNWQVFSPCVSPLCTEFYPNSRVKKIKCLQHTPETKCEACKASKIPCRFRDRERYFEERSRAIAGSNSSPHTPPATPPVAHPHGSPRSDSDPYHTPPLESSQYAGQATYPASAPRLGGIHHGSLFDPDHPGQPNATLMPHFILLFFEHIGHECPFMSYEETLEKLFHRTLSPLQSSCIAALAARHVPSSVAPRTYINNPHQIFKLP